MRCLCLNSSYEPIGFLPQNRAVQIFLEDKVDILEEGPGVYRSTSGISVPEPLVIRLRRYLKIPRDLNESISPRVLFSRDNYTCQYCGKHQSKLRRKNKLTIDHIKPKSQGGPHHWENVVTCCYFCNLKKRDRTPFEANMKFVDLYKNKSPRKPYLLTFTWGGRVTPEQEKWITMYYKVETLNERVKDVVATE